MASTVWKGYISFGLISVPVRLYAAAREEHVSFNQIHTVCGSRIKQQTYCPVCERVVERSELAKGYPVGKDSYVLVTSDELKKLEADSSEVMEILQFVKLDEVDPIYYQTSYYSAAEEPGRKAYTLLLQGMEKLNVAAIAKVTLHQREQIVLIRPYHHGILLHTLYYPAEVREIAEYGKDEDMSVQKAEVSLTEEFIRHLTGAFNPGAYKDEYRDRVLQLVETKEAGQAAAVSQAPRRKLAPVIDLMEALKKSIEQQGQQGAKPAVAATGKKPPQRAASAEAKPGRRKKAG
ncbi:MAG TPA: Ku protein [Acidobacteriaceae bacterium]|jgi:DNA end-binding protein Ku|nr:Ku protein [Acidobacteriaceae bacterium]